MFRAAAFLIALALTGAPVASLACEAWCTSPSAQDHRRIVGCHSQAPAPGEGQASVALDGTCHGAVSGTLFVTDSRSHAPDLSAALAIPPHFVRRPQGGPSPARAPAFDVSATRAQLRSVLRL